MNIYILSDKKVEGAINLPLLEIEFIKKDIDYTLYDALVFTSKNAIYSIDAISKEWTKIPSYAISQQTANVIKKHDGNLRFTGISGHGDKFALELIDELKGKNVLYIRGKKTVSNLAKILNEYNIKCDETIVYKTKCKVLDKKVILPKGSSIIFSSPSTIECFFKNYTWDESFKAISIGKTTAKYFPSNITPFISDSRSLEACVKKAKLINNL